MEIRKLLLVACSLGLISISSCDREAGKKLIIPNNQTKVSPVVKEAYLSLSIQPTNAVVLRSGAVEPMSMVKNLMLLFYDAKTKTLKDIKDITATVGATKHDISVKLQASDYKLVVLANATAKVREHLHLGASLDAMEQGIALSSSDLFNDGQSSLVMSNEQGIISVDRARFAATAEESQRQALSISLEPSLARVLVYGNPTLRAGKKSDKPIKYCVNNLPRQIYLVRKLAKLSTGVMEQAGDQSTVSQRYAESPLWSVWGDTKPVNTEGIATYPLASLTASNMRSQALASVNDFQTHRGDASLYWKESTMPERACLQGIAPYVHIAFPYIPEGLELRENEGWLSYEGSLYSESKAKDLLKSAESTEPLALALRREQVQEADFAKPEGFSRGGIQFFYQGYSYYAVFIKHFSGSNVYGRYGIVRGNEYRIQLVSINNAGSPTPIRYDGNLDGIEESKPSNFEVRVRALGEVEQRAEL